MTSVPTYLSGYEDQYEEDPKAAALEWFEDVEPLRAVGARLQREGYPG